MLACPRPRGRPAAGGLILLLLCRPAFGEMRPPKQLSNKSLHAAWRYLTHKDLDLLGDWRFDKDLLVELNRALVGRRAGVIDNFFVPSLAEMLHNESVQLFAGAGSLGDPWEKTPLGPLGLKEYNKHFEPGKRCSYMGQAFGAESYFRYKLPQGHRAFNGGGTLPGGTGDDLPGRVAVQKLFRQRKWIKGWTILLTGTDKGTDSLYMTHPDFREYRGGDYINMHTDHLASRKLCFNYWTPSPDWKPEWGGGFVWCGAGLPNYQQPHMPHFPPAFRAPTRYNQVGMFVPTEESWHTVDLVSDAADPSHHRFSFTSWLAEGPPPGYVEL